MTSVEVEAHWSEEAKTLCRLYQSLQPGLSDLPATDLLELSRKIATDLVFRMSSVAEPDARVDDALTSVSAVCQCCLFERSTVPANP